MITARYSWNEDTGAVDSHKMLFYVFEEVYMLAFFATCSLIALFWAELFYIATDAPHVRATHQTPEPNPGRSTSV